MLRIETPQLEESRGGLFSAIEPIKSSSQNVNFAEQFEGVLDADPRIISLFREQSGAVSKEASKVSNVDTLGFTAYSMIDDSLLYTSGAAVELKASHERRLSPAVENALEARLLAPKAVDLTPTPGTAVANARAALGILEQYAGANSGFLPVIHTNRLGASMLRDLKVDESNWKLHTKQGSPVANGAGYTGQTIGGITPTADQAWVYVTTGLVILRSDNEVVEGYEIAHNVHTALVETDILVANFGVIGAVLLGS